MNCPASTQVPGPQTIVRGRTWRFEATAYTKYLGQGDPGNVVLNFTGWTVKAQIRTKTGNKLVAVLPVVFPVPTSGAVAINTTRAFSKGLKAGDYKWDIVGTDPTGKDRDLFPEAPLLVREHPTDPAL